MRIFIPFGIIVAAGLITLSSISRELFLLQCAWVTIGIVVLIIFQRVDWQIFFNYRGVIWLLYAIAIGLLILAYTAGPTIRNTRSWLVFGPFHMQPVELAKIALILVYAEYFSRRHLTVARWSNIFTSFVFFAIPAGLTALQPDLGSATVLFGIWFGFLLVSGLPRRRIIAAILAFAIIGAVGWQYGLRDYQRARIRGVFYPTENVLGVNYSTAQSKIAIGSAGLWGKGYGQGTQTQLKFLTEPSNDFILAAFIEEWGLIFGFLLIAAFAMFILRILRIGLMAGQNFERFICLGTAMVFSIHFLLNAGSVVGFVPVIGVPFPFLSYGGSNLLANFFLLGLVYAISKRT